MLFVKSILWVASRSRRGYNWSKCPPPKVEQRGRVDPFEFIKELLSESFKRLVYFPNPGNLGDGLIALATIQSFERLNIPFSFVDSDTAYNDPQTLYVYGGGGNYIPEYAALRGVMDRLSYYGSTLVVLPHSSYGMTEHLNSYKGKLFFFARELETYERLAESTANIDLFHYDDLGLSFNIHHRQMAYYNSLRRIIGGHSQAKTLHAFRTDKESAKSMPLELLETSHDLSAYFLGPDLNKHALTNPSLLYQHVAWLFAYVLPFEEVATDRLHVAIASLLSGKKVDIYDNSYGKLSSVYHYSLKERFPGMITYNDQYSSIQ